jgi:hypothetical protein
VIIGRKYRAGIRRFFGAPAKRVQFFGGRSSGSGSLGHPTSRILRRLSWSCLRESLVMSISCYSQDQFPNRKADGKPDSREDDAFKKRQAMPARSAPDRVFPVAPD